MAALHSGLLSVILQVELVFLLLLHKLEISGLDIHEIRKAYRTMQKDERLITSNHLCVIVVPQLNQEVVVDMIFFFCSYFFSIKVPGAYNHNVILRKLQIL